MTDATGDTRIIIGTAGHVDHGKTALVRFLTGQDTDRLPEEKRREISIELGFAQFILPSGRRAGIVDVPGHEKFIRHMAGGAYGMDVVLFVVAANEGVMPQTREHLAICALLGVKRAVIVITKTDLVDADRVESVKRDIEALGRGTFLEGAPAFPVSSVTGEGIEALIRHLDDEVGRLQPRPDTGLFRLPVDRAFTKQGFGTVVTGTLHGGRVHPGDIVRAMPAGVEGRVRQVQVHGEQVEVAGAGQRVALNVVGLQPSDGLRGGLLIASDAVLQPVKNAYATLRLLPDAPSISPGEVVALHALTSSVPCQVVFLDPDARRDSGDHLVRLVSREGFWVIAGDRFILRRLSPAATLGGGEIITTWGRFRKGREEDLADLRTLAEGGEEGRLKVVARREFVIPPADARVIRQRHPDLVARGQAVDIGTRLVGGEALRERLGRLARRLADAARATPKDPGVPVERIRARIFPELDHEDLMALLGGEAAAGRVDLGAGVVAAPGTLASLGRTTSEEAQRLLDMLVKAGAKPPSDEDMARSTGLTRQEAERALRHLVQTGSALRVGGIVFAKSAVDEVQEKLLAHLDAHGEITASEFRDLADTSRKYAIPLLEFFDGRHVTRRRGDVRERW